jgi:hypothetical protein
MKTFSLLFFLLLRFYGFSQIEADASTAKSKNKFYIYWGWNRSVYSSSNIHFVGDSYDFTLDKVHATDRQSVISFNNYLNLKYISIPQYNFRLGYFINDHYNVSLGVDHMKYVMEQDQYAVINGTISQSYTLYDGIYQGEEIQLKADFLKFEHTDGLNYLNSEIRRQDQLFKYKAIKVSLSEGIGAGILMPKTNATLLNNARHDDFNVAGYGLGAVVGLQLELFKYAFIQTEFKNGFIHMPNIRTTHDPSDKAKQHFFYSELIIVFGANFAF